jgi:hypothetical protein
MVSGLVSLATLLDLNDSKYPEQNRRLQVYVWGWLAFLGCLLFFGPPLWRLFGPAFGWFAAVVAIYRFQDLVFASLDNVFGLTPRGVRWQERPGVSPVVIALWNIVQVTVIFALLYQIIAHYGSGVFEGPKGDEHGPSTPFGYLYLSWTTLFPPGSGYSAISGTARGLFMAEGASGLLIIGLTLAALLSRMGNDQTSPATGTAPTPPPSASVLDMEKYAKIVFYSLLTSVVAGFVGGVLAAMVLSA